MLLTQNLLFILMIFKFFILKHMFLFAFGIFKMKSLHNPYINVGGFFADVFLTSVHDRSQKYLE